MRHSLRRARLFLLVPLILLTVPALSSRPGPKADPMAVPAEFAQYLSPPGKRDAIEMPGRIHFDHHARELFITDIRNNRILIFDSNSVFRFQFFGDEHFSSPRDVAVTPDGYIYVLGRKDGAMALVKFDYDGLFLASFDLPAMAGNDANSINTMAAGRDGRLYLLDERIHEIMVADSLGAVVGLLDVGASLGEKERRNAIYGQMHIRDSLLYLPISSFGSVSVYTYLGRYVRSFGIQGTTVGKMNFRVSVAVDDLGNIHVLDKNRYNISCYNRDGEFLGEFGGKGYSPGWFYLPHVIAINAKNQVIVGQVMNNSIQVCRPPAFLGGQAAAAIPAAAGSRE